jgi:hypothetical protein
MKKNEEQEAIAIVDAVADGHVVKLQGQQLPMIKHVPVLDNIMRYLHRAQLHQYLADRAGNREPYWQATSLASAEQVNKPTGRSRWAAARRTLDLFNWLGHRSNLNIFFDKQLEKQIIIAKCPHCGKKET